MRGGVTVVMMLWLIDTEVLSKRRQRRNTATAKRPRDDDEMSGKRTKPNHRQGQHASAPCHGHTSPVAQRHPELDVEAGQT